MESALLPLQHVSGLEIGPASIQVGRSWSYRLCHHFRHSCNLREEQSFYAARRYGSTCTRHTPTIRAFLFATATQALAIPSFRFFSAIHLLLGSLLPSQRYNTDRHP